VLIKILVAVALIVVVLVVIVALQPKEYRVARSTTISAPPSAVFAQVNDFHNGKHGTRGGRSIRR